MQGNRSGDETIERSYVDSVTGGATEPKDQASMVESWICAPN